ARTSAGLVPTAVGSAFLGAAEGAIRASQRARATKQAGAGELDGELVVAAQVSLGTRELPGGLSALRRRFPRREVTVFAAANPSELDRLARRGVVDLVLMAGSCDGGPYVGHHLGDEEFVVVMSPEHAQLAGERVELRVLERRAWIRFDHDRALDAVLRDVLR